MAELWSKNRGQNKVKAVNKSNKNILLFTQTYLPQATVLYTVQSSKAQVFLKYINIKVEFICGGLFSSLVLSLFFTCLN